MVTGNFGVFTVLTIAALLIYKLSAADIKEVLTSLIKSWGWLGYPVAILTALGSWRILMWREGFYKAEMDRIVAVKNQAIQERLELPLQSSVRVKKLE